MRPSEMIRTLSSRLLTSRQARLVLLVLAVFTCVWWTLPGIATGLPNLAEKVAHHHHNDDGLKYAIATFLSGEKSTVDIEDEYFRTTRLLAYQILHAPTTRSRRTLPFVVMVTNIVPQWKRDKLTADGATVVEVDDVPLASWIGTDEPRWKDQFTKLRLLEMTQYDRVLYVDADMLIMSPLDGIFDTPEVRKPAKSLTAERQKEIPGDEGEIPKSYMFCGRPDNGSLGGRNHKFPPGHSDMLNAGFWVAAPSTELYQHFLAIMEHKGRFDSHQMEQSLLNYALRRKGPMPWCEIDPLWTATWPNLRDLKAGVRSLHGKFWKKGPAEMMAVYAVVLDEMEAFYNTTRPGDKGW